MHIETFLITNDGKSCPAVGLRDGATGETAGAGCDVIQQTVRQTGWIGVEYDRDRQEIALTFQAMEMADKAVTAVCALLLIPKLNLVTLKYDLHGAQSEALPNGSDASMRIMEIAKAAEDLRRKYEFFAAAKDPEILFQEGGAEAQRLAGLLKVWRDSMGVFSNTTIPLLREFGLLSRTLLIEPTNLDNSGKFTFIGQDFTVYGANWPEEGVGMPVEQQFDSGYGAWVAKALTVMRETRLPQYEHIDARIRRPNGEHRRSRYKCLRTYWRDRNNNPILMTNSLITPHVDIPLLPVQSSVV